MMSKDPAFPFYAQDFLTGVMHFNMAERGMYITLLAYQWEHGKIPKKRLGFILGYDWETCWEHVSVKFVSIDDDFVYNIRLESEREKRKLFKEKQANNGKLGGRPRKEEKPNETQDEAKLKPLESDNEKVSILRHDGFKKECLSSDEWKYSIFREKLLKEDTIELALNDYNIHLIQQGESKFTLGKYKSHFVNWVRTQKKK